jgi:hypothetical protein
MKALISPNERFPITWVSEWARVGEKWVPTYSTIEDCLRVAEVEPEEFDVADPLFWVGCPENCVSDEWYYKDDQVHPKPQSKPNPEPPPPVLLNID